MTKYKSNRGGKQVLIPLDLGLGKPVEARFDGDCTGGIENSFGTTSVRQKGQCKKTAPNSRVAIVTLLNPRCPEIDRKSVQI